MKPQSADPHSQPVFDSTFGYSQDQLLKIQNPEPPEDFSSFWQDLHRRVQEATLSYSIEKELWSPEPCTRIFLVRFTAWDGCSIGMWIARPDHSRGGLLIGQGYGNNAVPVPTRENGLTIAMPCLRGLGLSQCKEIPWHIPQHALHGIAQRETYVITRGIADLWMALRVLMDLFPDTASCTAYNGGSLGGGMGTITTAFEPALRAAEINVPNFGGKISLECRLSSEDTPGEQRRLYVLNHPECTTLDYLDASAAARLLKVPVLMTPALSDPSNPPPGQFAIANAIPDQYRILRIREVGHTPPTPKDQLLNNELNTIGRELGVRN